MKGLVHLRNTITKVVDGKEVPIALGWEYDDGDKIIDIMSGYESYRDELQQEYPDHKIYTQDF